MILSTLVSHRSTNLLYVGSSGFVSFNSYTLTYSCSAQISTACPSESDGYDSLRIFTQIPLIFVAFPSKSYNYDSLRVFTQSPLIPVMCPFESDGYNSLRIFTRSQWISVAFSFESNRYDSLRLFRLREFQLLHTQFLPSVFT
jgi:hypothetical protein